jgi:hypothetical protein
LYVKLKHTKLLNKEVSIILEDSKKFTDPAVLERIREIENSPENLRRLKAAKSGMEQNRTAKIKWVIGCLITCFIALIATNFESYSSLIAIVIIFIAAAFVGKLNDTNVDFYLENFLVPVLQQTLPDTTVDYGGGIRLSVLELVTPPADRHRTNCHIKFGDSLKTEFCNLYAYDEETDEDGKTTTTQIFKGQVFTARYDTNLKGHIRIVPTGKSLLFGIEFQNGYRRRRKGEIKLETEDIFFNESHNVYCTDELTARMLLNPYLLSVLDDWAKTMPVAVYMDENMVAASFYTRDFILKAPVSKKQIDNLSLSSEYEKIQKQLSEMYKFIDTLNNQI